MSPGKTGASARSKEKDLALEEEKTDAPSAETSSSLLLRWNSMDGTSDGVRDQIRRQVVQEFLEACGDNETQKRLVRELASRVLRNDRRDRQAMEIADCSEVEISDSDEDELSEDSNKYKWADMESIQEIEDSPYEANASAEVGLTMFEEFKTLLEPEKTEAGSSRRTSGRNASAQPTKKAMQLFGEKEAKAMVAANFHVEMSGMVYSPSWREGKIRDHVIQGLSKPMLLMILQQQRFCRAERGVLSKLVEDLLLASIVREALDDWNIERLFPKLANCTATPFPYCRSRKIACQKCEVFVARAYACMNMLKQYKIENEVSSKVLRCLRIMEEHVEFQPDMNEATTGVALPKQIQVPNSALDSSMEADSDASDQEGTHRTGYKSRKALHLAPSEHAELPFQRPEVAMSKGVERLDIETGRVLERYASVREANLRMGKNKHANNIGDVFSGRSQSAWGFFWRRQGSKTLPKGLKEPGLNPRDNTAVKPTPESKQAILEVEESGSGVERLDLETGEVLQRYSCTREANLSMGKKPKTTDIYNAISGRQKAAFGFFWRRIGSQALPEGARQHDANSKSPLLKEKARGDHSFRSDEVLGPHREDLGSSKRVASRLDTPVVNISMENGKKLECFKSVKAANLILGRKEAASDLPDVLAGRRQLSAGFSCKEMRASHIAKIAGSPIGTKKFLSPDTISISQDERKKAAQEFVSGRAKFEESESTSNDPPNRTNTVRMPIEQVDLKTGRFVAAFESLQGANAIVTRKIDNPEIEGVLDGQRPQSAGFFWHEHGSNKLSEGTNENSDCFDSKDGEAKPPPISTAPPPSGLQNEISSRVQGGSVERSRGKSIEVEKINSETGRVVARFKSISDANLSIGLHRNSSDISRAVAGGRSIGGFFWRKVGGTISDLDSRICQPSTPVVNGCSKNSVSAAVEKLDMKTGEVLGSYTSIQEANLSLGKDPKNSHINDTLAGRQKSSAGFFWRRVGTSNLPAGLSTGQLSQVRKPSQETSLQLVSKRPRDAIVGSDGGKAKRQRPDRTDCSESRSDLVSPQWGSVTSNVPFQNLKEMLYTPSVDTPKTEHATQGRGLLRTIAAMTDIVESPYQEHATAEVGEAIFDVFKALLVPAVASKRKQSGASDIAVRVLGEKVANTITEASSRIGVAGVVYSSDWREGIIRGALPGPIPKPLLLLLLQEQRFSRPGVIDALTTVVTDFDLCNVMKRALIEWKLEARFWKLSQVTIHTNFTSRKSQCYRCLIFIARAFYCIRFLQLETVPATICRKVDACLHILEANIGQRAPRTGSVIENANIVQQMLSSRQEARTVGENSDDSSFDGASIQRGPPKAITVNSHVLLQHLGAAVAHGVSAKAPALPLHNPPHALESANSPLALDSRAQRRAGMKMAPKLHLANTYRFGGGNACIEQPASSTATDSYSLRLGNDIEWFPRDPKEIILTPIEIEIAWLVEEGIYCLRKKDFHWSFLWKYASPTLKVELRKTNDGSADQLRQIVRMHDTIVATRFNSFRREIRRKLHQGNYRVKMKDLIPKIRLQVRVAEQKQIAFQAALANKAASPSQLERTDTSPINIRDSYV